MDRNFDIWLKAVLKSEGGWSDNPADPGGPTMKGVTLANFRKYVKADATKADLKKITDAQLAVVYRRFYWDAVLAAQLPDGVDFATADFAVNSGPSRAAKALQKVVGAVQDGRIGPATLKAVEKMGAVDVVNALCDERMRFLKGLSTFKTFGRGWTSRVSSVRTTALGLAARPAPVIVQLPAAPAEAPVQLPAQPVIVETKAGEDPVVKHDAPVPPAAQPTVPQKHTGWLTALALAIAGIAAYLKAHFGVH